MAIIDLTPFGFTPTESLVYGALLRLGPATGYGVARAVRLARANAYSALEGLVTRGAAYRSAGRPVQFRPADPAALLTHLAAQQGEALDRLSRELKDASRPGEPATHVVTGSRAAANVAQHLVARADTTIRGVFPAELWRQTLPAWRRAAARAKVDIRLAGEPADTEGIAGGSVGPDNLVLLLIDDTQVFTASGTGEQITALWSTHPLIVALGRGALGGAA